MATIEQLTPAEAPVAAEEPALKAQVVSKLLSLGLTSYQWGKQLTLAQLPAVEAPLEYIEATVVATTTDALSRAKMTPGGVVKSLDSKTCELIEYYEVEQKSEAAKVFAVKQLNKIKTDEEKKLEEEILLQELIADAREVAWDRVAGLQTQAEERADAALDKASDYVDHYLPATEEEKDEQPEPEVAPETRVARVNSITKIASRRFKKRAMAKLAGVTLKLREARPSAEGGPIVHLDLVRYAELLDLAAVRERVVSTAEPYVETIKSTESFGVVKGFVVKASEEAERIKDAGVKGATEMMASADDMVKVRVVAPAKEMMASADDMVKVRVVAPAKEYYAICTAEFIKRAKSAEDLRKLAGDEYTKYAQIAGEYTEARKIDGEKYVASVRAALGAAWNDRLLKPTLAFFEFCKVAYGGVHEAYLEGKKGASDTAPDGRPFTIKNGVEAFVAAMQKRLEQEWETTVKPAYEQYVLKKGAAEETTEEVFVDASN